MSTYEMTLFGIDEAVPGPRWQALFDTVWPAYRSWYLSEGREARPDLQTAVARLQRHMPELVPTWRRLVERTGADELAATMLTLWDTPKFLPGCSQAVLTRPTPALVRNYDYSPGLFEQVVWSSRFTERRVIGTGDCLWGLLDGMNDAGLAVSLAFGGRPGSAPGFAAPLVVRYLLEVCDTVEQARQRLVGLPVSMSYNLTMVDAGGDAGTAYVAPHQEPEFFPATVATNHHGDVPEHPAHAARFRSVERQQLLAAAVAEQPSVDALAAGFLQRPVFSDDYDGAFGTLYTAVYRPAEGVVDYLWRHDQWSRTFSSPEETKTVVLSSEPGSDEPVAPVPAAVPADVPNAGSAPDWEQFAATSSRDIAELTTRMIVALSHRPDQAAFAELIGLYEVLGVAMGESARTVAEHGSWSKVAGVAGVSRQAAWARWSS